VCDALPHLDPARVQVLHLTGPKEFDEVRQAYAAQPALTAHVAPFCQRMELAYTLADVALTRSGASSLTELSASGIPSVLVPYPTAADDHQRRNAEVFTRAGAAVAVEESTLTGESLAALFNSLLGDEAKRQALAGAMRQLAPRDAAEKVCDAISGS
jgi:UDP-N-acetylglucosamine--N-acetylmuramyl-(pentapeptide) pyrophosphoryl-undecaprenol N-acetylglucosamine transferase